MNLFRAFLCILLITSFSARAQNKKFDKSLKKIDGYYASGEFIKAASALKKLKADVTSKMGPSNTYMPGLLVREARTNLASGILVEFEKQVDDALNETVKTFGETSKSYATALLQVAEMYNDYGNFRIAREYTGKAKGILGKTEEIEENFKAKIGLIEAEAMIGQGFCNDAIELLNSYEKHFATRAADKETFVENGEIKSRRVPEGEIYERFNDYAKLKTLLGKAYAQKGRFSVAGSNSDDPDADMTFKSLENWLKGKKRYLGETSLAEVQYRYHWSKALFDAGNQDRGQRGLEFSAILADLKNRTSPTNTLAHEIYLSHLEELLIQDLYARYLNVKLEYEKVINRYFPKTTVHRINLNAVEFNSKLSKEKTRDLENQAIGVLASKSLPRNYKTTVLVLEFLYEIALAEKKYSNAENYLNQIAEAQKELCGEASPNYHLARLALANFYVDYTNKIEEAGKIYNESYFSLVDKQISEQHKSQLEILNHIAVWYELTDRYSDASKMLKRAQEASRLKYRSEDIVYAQELNNIAKLQIKLGEYEQAEKNIKQALEIIDLKANRDLPEWRPTFVGTLETKAKLFGIKGLFDEAEETLEESATLIRKSKGAMSEAQSTTQELIPLMILLGRYSEAAKLLDAQIPQYEKLYGNQSLRLIEPLVQKSRILLARGNYPDAERFASIANRIAVKTYGEISTKTAPTQKILSDIYYTLGDYEKAEAEITRAVRSQEKQFGRNHIEVAKSLSQLALIKFHKGDNRKQIETLLLEARSIMEEKLGKDNPQYAEVLKNVAIFYISEKKFDIAFNSLTVAEGIWRAKTGSKNNINAASIFTLTGDVYYQIKNYRRAEDFYLQAKNLYEKYFSINHPEYVKVLSRMSRVYYMEKDYKRSKKLIEEALNNYEIYIKQFFPALSEREKAKYWNTIKGDFEFYNTLAFSNLEDFRDLTGKVYNYQLLTKALLLSTSIKIRERILSSTDEDLKSQFNTWVQKKELLTLALSMSTEQLTENAIDPIALQQEVERLEKDLSQKSELFGQSFESKRLTYDDVKKALKDNEVAIEMVRYRHFNHQLTDSVVYAALYVTPSISRPKVILLPDGKKLESRYFKYYRNSIIGRIRDEVSYNVFWKPIHTVIGNTSTIYLSADGIYNQINLESIPSPDGRYVIDNSNIILVSNTKDLYIRKITSRAKNPDNSASMFGNPTFYMTASNRQNILPLPGTEKEINQVRFMLKQKGWLTAEYVENTASEENVKGVNSPKIFHIATHGFYRPTIKLSETDELEGNEAKLAQNPLLRTGLLLKGAGDLMSKTEHNYNIESGILTADEAMSLNLDKTDLVVLSACETGLGDLEAGEGVYGLQRAFLVAGAKVLIMSMFKVDDDATQKLMLVFYQKWLNSGKLRESFIDAKKELRTEYPDPIFWGAFMMIGLE